MRILQEDRGNLVSIAQKRRLAAQELSLDPASYCFSLSRILSIILTQAMKELFHLYYLVSYLTSWRFNFNNVTLSAANNRPAQGRT